MMSLLGDGDDGMRIIGFPEDEDISDDVIWYILKKDWIFVLDSENIRRYFRWHFRILFERIEWNLWECGIP